jgi:hypothetical protein
MFPVPVITSDALSRNIMLSLLAVHEGTPKSPPKHTVVAEALPGSAKTPAKARAPANAEAVVALIFITVSQ